MGAISDILEDQEISWNWRSRVISLTCIVNELNIASKKRGCLTLIIGAVLIPGNRAKGFGESCLK